MKPETRRRRLVEEVTEKAEVAVCSLSSRFFVMLSVANMLETRRRLISTAPSTSFSPL